MLFPISDQFEIIRSTINFALFLLLGLSCQVRPTLGTFLETALTRLKSIFCSGGGDVGGGGVGGDDVSAKRRNKSKACKPFQRVTQPLEEVK